MIDWADFFGKNAQIKDSGSDLAWDDELEQDLQIGDLEVCRNGVVKYFQYEYYYEDNLILIYHGSEKAP